MSVADLTSEPALDDAEGSPPGLEFPLPFAPFERLMLLEDRPGYPMTIHVEVGFAGQLQREPFIAAVQHAIGRHPLLAANMEWRGRWPWWAGLSENSAPVLWNESEPPETPIRHAKIDIAQGPGVHTHVHVGQERSSILFLLHHSCCDGQGARRFIFDVLSEYDRLALGEKSRRIEARLDNLRREKLMARHEFAPAATKEVTTEVGTSAWERVRNALAFVIDRPQPLTQPHRTRVKSSGSVHHHLFDVETTTNFRKRAQADGATFNDVAVAKLMQILVAWNRKHGRTSDRHFVRVCVPTDLRLKGDDNLPAANRMGYAFLTRRFGDMNNWQSLISGVSKETNYIKDYRVGLDFVTNISIGQAVPFILPAVLKWTRCLTTSTLTNLGDATRRLRRRFPGADGKMVIGGLPVDYIHVTPPVRPGTRAGFGMVVCSGRLSVSLVTDPYYFDDHDTQALLESYVNELQTWSQTDTRC